MHNRTVLSKVLTHSRNKGDSSSPLVIQVDSAKLMSVHARQGRAKWRK